MRRLRVMRGDATATATIEKDERGLVRRTWSGDRALVRECERAVERYLADPERERVIEIPPARVSLELADRDTLAHHILLVAAVRTYLPNVEIENPFLARVDDDAELVYY
jgi:hypothetical protein